MKSKTVLWLVAGLAVVVLGVLFIPRLLKKATAVGGVAKPPAQEKKHTLLGKFTSGGAPLAQALGLPDEVSAGFKMLDQFTF